MGGMRQQSRRRSIRFTLRSAFLAITALCCWLGWESSIVHERRAALQEIREGYAFQITTAADWESRLAAAGIATPSAAKISLVRGWLGDEAVQEIHFIRGLQGFSDEKLERLTQAFPEAEVHESYPEPCHPGCFPSGTLVDTPRGPRPIDTIQPGDVVSTFVPGDLAATAIVQSVFVTENQLWNITTEKGSLVTTQTQPLCSAADRIIPAGKLDVGTTILQKQEGGIASVKVRQVSPCNRTEKVFNLVLGGSEVFFANGFLARSKPPEQSTDQVASSAARIIGD